ncbi:MAG: hypothetical protein RL757_977 [Bacteroidota bacterium]|jgi:hypothetical protein
MKKLFYFLSIVLTVSLTSCLDILEEIRLKKDGSGAYTMRIDATEFMTQIESFAEMDTTGQMMPKMKHTLDSTFGEVYKLYVGIKGISNVKLDTSKSGIYVTSFDFENVTALNAAMEKSEESKKGESKETKVRYAFEKGKFTRSNTFGELDMSSLLGDTGEDQSQKAMVEEMLEKMTMTVRYYLPEKVKEVDNKKAVVSEDKMSISLETNFKELSEKKVGLGIEVKYKK